MRRCIFTCSTYEITIFTLPITSVPIKSIRANLRTNSTALFLKARTSTPHALCHSIIQTSHAMDVAERTFIYTILPPPAGGAR